MHCQSRQETDGVDVQAQGNKEGTSLCIFISFSRWLCAQPQGLSYTAEEKKSIYMIKLSFLLYFTKAEDGKTLQYLLD